MIVICARCGEQTYDCLAVGRDFSGDAVRPEDFVPLSPGVPAPVEGSEMKCPACQNTFCVPTAGGGVVLKLERGYWWPHPPVKQS